MSWTNFKIIHIIFILGIVSAGYSQQNYFLTLSSTKARPLAMGGAYTAIEDDIVSTFYNPATLSLYPAKKDYRVTFFLNPIGLSTLLSEQIHQNDNEPENGNQFLQSIGLLFKALVFTGKFVDISLVFNEQLIDANTIFQQKQLFDDCDIWSNSYHTLATRVKLADKVAIGVAGSYYTKEVDSEKLRGFGFSYGILLKPAPYLNVGLAFIDFPQQIPEVRLPLERIADQTMNIGVSYRPFSSTIFSLDIRNLTEEQQKSVREAHFGIEQNIFSIMAIRCGYFQERFSNNRTYSAGLALFDSNLIFSKERQFNHPQFILNYSFIHQKKDTELLNWHVISFVVRI
ncbi:MAG TPA: hypothetical protein VGD14_20080 [bacterium]